MWDAMRSGADAFERMLVVPPWKFFVMFLLFFVIMVLVLFRRAPVRYIVYLSLRYTLWFGLLAGATFFTPGRYRFLLYYFLILFVALAFMEMRRLACLWGYVEKKLYFANNLISWLRRRFGVPYRVRLMVVDFAVELEDESGDWPVDKVKTLRPEFWPFDASIRYILAAFSDVSRIFKPFGLTPASLLLVNGVAPFRENRDSDAFIMIPVSALFLNRDALTFLIAHEFGHHYLEHTLEKGLLGQVLDLLRKSMESAIFVYRDVIFSGRIDISEEIININWNQREEKEADLLATRVLAERGANVDRAMRFFHYVVELSGGYNLLEKLFGSHPDTRKRIEYISRAYHRYIHGEQGPDFPV